MNNNKINHDDIEKARNEILDILKLSIRGICSDKEASVEHKEYMVGLILKQYKKSMKYLDKLNS